MSRELVIRADAGPQIGMGHVMRCLALAQAWQQAGGHATFVMAKTTPALVALIETEGMSVVRLMTDIGDSDDAKQMIACAHKFNVQWVVVDGYHFGGNYQRAIKDAGLSLLFIDDYGHADHYYADLVLNQNIHAEVSLYNNREPSTRLLLGIRYALLRREFWPWRGWQREVPSVACKILVTMGGSDPDNVTLSVAQALQQMSMECLETRIVVGAANPHFKILRKAISGANRNCTLLTNVTNMPELMAWADIAISAGGSTNWEMAFMGLPALVIILADNQRPVAEGLETAGIVVNLGWHKDFTLDKITTSLNLLANDPERRLRMTQSGQEQVDGIGVERVRTFLNNQGIVFRMATSEDCRLIWEWANDPVTRANSFSSAPIPWDNHVAWFQAKLADPQTIFYIILADSIPIGQIRFRIDGQEAVVSISMAPDQRGKGYSSQIIKIASAKLIETTSVKMIHAYIKSENMASIRAFIKGGYIQKGTTDIHGDEALHFVIKEESL